MGGNAPTGRYSHAATMVGSNIIMTFGTNNAGVLDTERCAILWRQNTNVKK